MIIGALAYFTCNMREVQPRVQKLPPCNGRVFWSIGFILEQSGRTKLLMVCEPGQSAAFRPGDTDLDRLEADGAEYLVAGINAGTLWMNMEERFDARPFELAALLGKVPEIPEELGKMPLPNLPICEIVLLDSLDALPTGPVDVVLSSGERWHLAP